MPGFSLGYLTAGSQPKKENPYEGFLSTSYLFLRHTQSLTQQIASATMQASRSLLNIFLLGFWLLHQLVAGGDNTFGDSFHDFHGFVVHNISFHCISSDRLLIRIRTSAKLLPRASATACTQRSRTASARIFPLLSHDSVNALIKASTSFCACSVICRRPSLCASPSRVLIDAVLIHR